MFRKLSTRILCMLGICFLAGCSNISSDDETSLSESTLPVITETSVETLPLEEPVSVDTSSAETTAEVIAETTSVFYEKDGKQYQMVPDLVSGQYLWASAVTEGNKMLDDHGHETTDYYSQDRSFEHVDGSASIPVRRWDNLLYSAGDYLIYEYNGTVHVAKPEDIHRPVLSYAQNGTYSQVFKVPDGYMVSNDKVCSVIFYDENFSAVKTVNGYRAGESGIFYSGGLLAVRDMKTGLLGYMDQEGNLAIPCEYGFAAAFSNGYAAVLTGSEMIPYTEDAGTVAMYYGRGGIWGIIDNSGNYVLEPSQQYANKSMIGATEDTYYVFTEFTPVREDGTTDFISLEQDGLVLETVQIAK